MYLYISKRSGLQKQQGGKPKPVSYTHVDVYKRQLLERAQQSAPLSQAARDIAKQTGHPKGALYKAALKQRGPAGDEDL